nr:uncharacterized protein LOC129386932 isoform X2 [Dermacentor andersoni]
MQPTVWLFIIAVLIAGIFTRDADLISTKQKVCEAGLLATNARNLAPKRGTRGGRFRSHRGRRGLRRSATGAERRFPGSTRRAQASQHEVEYQRHWWRTWGSLQAIGEGKVQRNFTGLTKVPVALVPSYGESISTKEPRLNLEELEMATPRYQLITEVWQFGRGGVLCCSPDQACVTDLLKCTAFALRPGPGMPVFSCRPGLALVG